jgi:hypothetical protein
MSDAEKLIIELEDQFPTLAGAAFAAARKEALNAGYSVLQSEDGVIYEVFPDGTRIERKRIEPPTPVPAGTKFIIW